MCDKCVVRSLDICSDGRVQQYIVSSWLVSLPSTCSWELRKCVAVLLGAAGGKQSHYKPADVSHLHVVCQHP